MEEVKKIFLDYLTACRLRKTPERLAILEEIYGKTQHFDVESMYITMRQKFRVSRATVYNTLDLLIDCNLVRKHQFGSNLTIYEKSHGFRQHDHLICEQCDKILEFCDPRIQTIQEMVGKVHQFTITHHSLHFYGVCDDANCAGKKARTK